MRAREAFNRSVFRGARMERRGPHHAIMRRGDRRTTIPMYAGHVPWGILRRIEHDLDIDLRRPVRATTRADATR